MPGSLSVWGLSLNNSYHSLNIIVDRTSTHTEIHLIDQWDFDSYKAVQDFNNAIQYEIDTNSGRQISTFTQYKNN